MKSYDLVLKLKKKKTNNKNIIIRVSKRSILLSIALYIALSPLLSNVTIFNFLNTPSATAEGTLPQSASIVHQWNMNNTLNATVGSVPITTTGGNSTFDSFTQDNISGNSKSLALTTPVDRYNTTVERYQTSTLTALNGNQSICLWARSRDGDNDRSNTSEAERYFSYSGTNGATTMSINLVTRYSALPNKDIWQFDLSLGGVSASLGSNSITINSIWQSHCLVGVTATDDTLYYIDGVLRGTHTGYNVFKAQTPNITPSISSGADGANYLDFDGNIDNLTIWNTTLTAAEALQVYNDSFDDNTPGYSFGGLIGGTSNNDAGNAVAVDSTGAMYGTGKYTNNTIDFNIGAGSNTLSSTSTGWWVAKYDSSGAYQWAFEIDSSSVDVGLDATIDTSNNLYVMGCIGDDADVDPGAGTTTITTGGTDTAVIASYTSAGAYRWNYNLPYTGSTCTNTTAASTYKVRTIGTDVYILAQFTGTQDFDPGAGVSNLTATGTDVALVSLTSTGTFRWAQRIDYPSADALATNSTSIVAAVSDVGSLASAFVHYDTSGTVTNTMAFSANNYWLAEDIEYTGSDFIVTGTGNGDLDPGAGTTPASNVTIGSTVWRPSAFMARYSTTAMSWFKIIDYYENRPSTTRRISIYNDHILATYRSQDGNLHIMNTNNYYDFPSNGARPIFDIYDINGNFRTVRYFEKNDTGTTLADVQLNTAISNDKLYIVATFDGTIDVNLSKTTTTSLASSSSSNDIFISAYDYTLLGAPNTPTITTPTASSTTNDNTPAITGTSDASNNITVYEGATSLCTTTADGSGNWSCNSSALSDGSHTIFARADNGSGTTDSANRTFTVDATAPAAPVISTPAAASVTNDNTPTITGTGETGATVTVKEGVTTLCTATVVAGSWSCVSSALSDGSHTIDATQTDAAGNVGTATSRTFTVDSTAPSAPVITSPTGGSSTNDNTPTITGTGETGATVTVMEGVTTLCTDVVAAGSWSCTSSALSDGSHTIFAYQTDAASNQSSNSANVTFTVDTTADAAPGTPDMTNATDTGSSNSDNITSDTTPDFDITCVTGSTVTLYDNVTSVGTGTCVAGTVTITSSVLSSGAHNMNARQTDTSGNQSVASANLAITVDNTADAAPGTPDMTNATDTGSSNSDNITSDTTPDFTMTCVTGSTVTLRNNTTSIGTGLCAGGTVTITATPAFTAGTYTQINAIQTDTAGNTSPASGNLSITIDNTADAAPGTPDMTNATDTGSSNSDNITSDTTPDFDITCVTGSTVTLYDNVTSVGTGTCVAGTVTITSSTLSSGAHNMNARQNDTSGNQSVASANLAITIDSSADAAPGTPDLQAGSDSGVSNSDDITSDNTPTFDITCVTGSTVTLRNNLTSLGTGTCAGGTVAITSSVLADANYTQINAIQTDTAGNTSPASGNLSITIDTTSPASAPGTPDLQSSSDTGSSSTDNITSDTTPTFDIACSGTDIVRLYNGVTLLGSGTCAASTVTITSSALADAVYSMTAKHMDTAGNEGSASASPLSVTIDTTADAAPGTPDLQAGSDSGVSNSDNNTSDNTPTFDITCVTGSTVTLRNNLTSLGTGTCAGGTVAITSSVLADASYTLINAIQTDTAGNTSPASGNLSITIDTTSPASAPGTPDLQSSSDTGSSSTDNITSDTTPTFDIACSGTDTVRLLNGATVLGSGTCVASTVTITSSVLTDATYNLTARHVDTAGNQSSASAAISVTIDTSAPAAPAITTPAAASSTSDDTPNIVGTSEANAAITVKEGVTTLCTATADGSGNWNCNSSALSVGAHTIFATATDAAGNISANSPNITFNVTTGVSSPVITSPTTGTSTNDTTPTITGTGTNTNTIDVMTGITVLCSTVVAGGTWSCTSSVLAEGTYSIFARASDGVTDADSTIISLTIDTTAPAAPVITTPAAASQTNDNTPTITGTGETGATVTVMEGVTTLCTATVVAGSWSCNSSILADGSHTIFAYQTDAATNQSSNSANRTFTVDTVADAAPGTPDMTNATDTGSSNTDDITSDTTPSFTISCVTGSTVTLRNITTSLGTGTCAGSTVTITSSLLADGNYTQINAIQTDPAGNVSVASADLAITIDSSADAAPGTPDMTNATDTGSSNSDNITSDTTPDFTMTCVTGSTVTLRNNTTSIGTGLCAGGTVTITATPAFTAGTYTQINAIQTDTAGNTSAASANLSITIDTTADAAPGTPDMTNATDTGSSNTDNITSDTTPDFDITCITGSTVTLYDNVTSIGSALCVLGSVTITSSVLSNGVHNINATQTDTAGNTSVASTNLSATIDTTAPAAPLITSPTTGSVVSSSVTFTGTCSTTDIIAVSHADIISTPVTGTCTAGTYSIVVVFSTDGVKNNVQATATDLAGNVGPSTTLPTLNVTTNNTVTINQKSGQADPANSSPVLYTVVFTLPINTATFTNSDIVISGSATTTTPTITEVAPNNGTTFEVSIPVTADGTVLATINANTVNTAGLVPNDNSTSTDNNITVDTTADAAPGTPDMTNATDTGSSNSDNITSDTTPDFTMTCVTGSTVTLRNNTTSIGTGLCAGGTVTITATPAFTAGTYTQINAIQTDTAGNTSPASGNLSITIDNTAPVTPGTPDMTNATDTGSSNTDDITSDNTPTFDITCLGTDAISLYDGVTLLGSGTCSSGTVAITSSALAEGSHSLNSVATDLAGNISSPSTVLNITVDTTSPTIPTITSPLAGSSTNDNTPTISGTGENGSTVTVEESATVLCTAVVVAGLWSCTSSVLTDGLHSIVASATDTAGNDSAASAPLLFSVDTSPPSAPVVSLPVAASSTNDNTPNISGTGETGATVSVKQGVTTLCTATVIAGSWNCNSSLLADGVINLDVTQTDAAGNTSPTTTRSFIVDTTIPSAPVITAPTPSSITNDNTPTISGTGETGATVTVKEGATTLCTAIVAAGTWSCDSGLLLDGSHTISVTQEDVATNVSPASTVTFSIDTITPTAPNTPDLDTPSDTGVSSTDNITSDTTPTFTIACETGTTVTLRDNTTSIGTGTCVAATVSITPAALTDGVYTQINAIQFDGVNTSPASSNLSLTIDSTVPSTPVISSPTEASITSDTTPNITGTGENGSIVTVREGVTILCSATVTAGAWSCASSALTLAAHAITAIAEDVAGNSSPASAVRNFTVVAGPSSPVITTPITGSSINDNTPTFNGTGDNGNTITVKEGTNTVCTTTVAAGIWSCSAGTPLADNNYTITAEADDGVLTATSSPILLNIDTLAPAAPAITSPTNTTNTNDNTPTITGTGETGATVTVKEGASTLCTTTVIAGSWSCDSSLLPDGSHTITAHQTDPATNQSPDATNITFNIDTAAPSAPIITSPTPASYTNDNTPTITGTGETGATVTVKEGATNICTATVVAGSWGCTTPTLTDSLHNLDVTQIDPSGNTSPNSSTNFTVDTISPVAPIITSPAVTSITNDNTPTITGTGETGATVTVKEGATTLCTAVVDGLGNWNCTVTAPLGDAAHTLIAMQTDLASNDSPDSTPITVTVDTLAPAAPSIITPVSGKLTGDNTPTLVGTAEPDAIIIVRLGGVVICATNAAPVTGTWSCNLPAQPLGSNTYEITATDAANNISVATNHSLTITTGPTSPIITSPTDPTITNNPSVTFSGTADPTSEIRIVDSNTGFAVLCTVPIVGAGGNWTCTPSSPLTDGIYNILAVSDDGNSTADSLPLALTIDTLAPSAPTINVAPTTSGVVTSLTPTFNGTAEVGSTVTVKEGTTTLCTVVTGAGGTWACTSTSAMTDGNKTVIATATDVATNVSSPTTINFILDTTDIDGDGTVNTLDSDVDGDGVSNSDEDQGLNSGDGNNDSIKDSLQPRIASLPVSQVTQKPVVLEVSPNCTNINQFKVINMNQYQQLAGYDLPVGMADFTVTCAIPGDTANVNLYLDKQYDTTNWQWLKFNRSTQLLYNSNAVVSTATVGTLNLTKIAFSAKDGSTNDEDGTANGTIIDPAGPGIAKTSALSNTGVSSVVFGLSISVVIILATIQLKKRKAYVFGRK